MSADWLEQVKWDDQGLAPVVAQDWRDGRLLMQAWVNREALETSAWEGRAVYWSRSRGKLWRKGEDSGHVQRLHGILLDCDGDSLCYQVEQLGGIACHTGRASCYYRRLEDGEWQEAEPVLKDPSEIYARPQ